MQMKDDLSKNKQLHQRQFLPKIIWHSTLMHIKIISACLMHLPFAVG